MGENKNKRKLRKKYRRKQRNFMRIMLVTMMSIFMLWGALNRTYAVEISNERIALISNEINDNKDDNIEEDLTVDEPKLDEDNHVDENQKYKNTNDEGQKYIFDAKEVSKKLSKYDYSNDGKKIVFLTFDDGPSNTVTPKILKILKENDVKATFFVMGQELQDGGEAASNLLKQEFSEGHAIGNHSYSHDYDILYPNRSLDLEAFKNDYEKNNQLLKSVLGEEFSTSVIRCPGGYMSWKNMDKLDEYLNENNMAAIDWSALSKDAEGKAKNADELVQCAIETSQNQEMVVLLMHDTYGKEETAKSLPKIIEHFKNEGYEFRTLG